MSDLPVTGAPTRSDVMEKIVSLCKRRGFIFPSSEIYGGLASTWDYGPLGVLLKNNVKAAWWRSVVQLREDMVGLDAAILMHPETWRASGHVANFSDPLVDCKQCRQRFREDHLLEGKLGELKRDAAGKPLCPSCGGELTEARFFNLMFKTFMGPVEESAAVVYLRPETAQGIFVNFKSVLTALRRKPPFGIAQIGKAFRNEITPGNFTFRTREFEQMEIEYFVAPEQADEKWQSWVQTRLEWYVKLGIKREKLRLRPHGSDELAHYAKCTEDIEYQFPWDLDTDEKWSELEGIANRGDFDLRQHQEFSGKDLGYFDEESKARYLPHVIEPSAGADRGTLAFLVDSYDEETDAKGETRVVLRLHPMLAPYKVAVLPLSKKAELTEPARAIHRALSQLWHVDYDETQGIGRRYRRQDEIGTPYAVTIDFESLNDKAVTIRERDSMEQVRLPIDQVVAYLQGKLSWGDAPVLGASLFRDPVASEATGGDQAGSL